MKRYLVKELVELIKWKTSTVAGTLSKPSENSLENLCPACFAPLEKGLMSCTYCMAGFKKPRKALLESLVIPGWGDLYLGHKLLGSAELVGSLLIWRMAVSNLLAGETTAAVMLVLILIFYNGVDGLVTYHMAKKGYMIAQ